MKLLTNYYLLITGNRGMPAHLSRHTFRAQHNGVKGSGGFVALISAIIIASVLMIFVVGTGAGGFYTRFDVFGSEIKEVSYGLAEACVHTAILEVSQDSTYDGDETVPVDDDNDCKIVDVTPSGSTYIIEAQGEFQDSFTNLRVTVDDTNFAIQNWQEVAEH